MNIELILLLALVGFFCKPLGLHIARVLDVKAKTGLDVAIKPLERGIYRCCGIDPYQEQNWKEYLWALLSFSLLSLVGTFALLLLQSYLPFNPQNFSAPSWDLAFNTAISFMTNTDWQNYGGESTLSYFSQMVGLTVQNFLSPAVGLAVAAALVRSIARSEETTIGNFWVDLVRICLYLLLPFALITAPFFLWTGVPQNFQEYTKVTTLEGEAQIIAQGPVASQEAIKMIGSNGGGFMNVNSAHPYENPTPLSNFIQIFLILLIPAAQFYYYGHSVEDTRHGWCIIAAIAILFVTASLGVAYAESEGNPLLAKMGITGGNWEGKEVRMGIFPSSLFACATTAVSCGAVNCMHDSLLPISSLAPFLFMEIDEVIFGGVGAGLYSLILYIILAIFVSGLIIGRTPEYLGKKIAIFDVKMTMIAILSYVLLVHGGTVIALSTEWGRHGIENSGPHGFSEILYAFSSCAANNGSAFAGLSADTVNYNLSLAIAMLLGRFSIIIPVIALAGSFVRKKIVPKSAATFPISSRIFISLLIGVIILLGALTFLPALTMGPIIEQFEMLRGMFSP
ncbi:MAG: potassium-transporting ATPase subunit KdpA [Verrucomicrobiota bacterium]|nr:potassium-transporting ATPase subunit KdpA [Verrucomicrobiota bacterium]